MVNNTDNKWSIHSAFIETVFPSQGMGNEWKSVTINHKQ